jgi:hypothetical protein
VVDATLVAVNSSRIQKEKKYHGEHRRKHIGYNHLTIQTAGLSGDNEDREW